MGVFVVEGYVFRSGALNMAAVMLSSLSLCEETQKLGNLNGKDMVSAAAT